jgi:hypothetical protein
LLASKQKLKVKTELLNPVRSRTTMKNSNDIPKPNRLNNPPSSKGADANWADFLDQNKIDGVPRNTSGLRPIDVDDARIDELEVDSMLQQLAHQRLEKDSDEFTNRVAIRIAESDSQPHRRRALPVPTPSPGNPHSSATSSNADVETENTNTIGLTELDKSENSGFQRNWLAVATFFAGVVIFTAIQFYHPGQVGDRVDVLTNPESVSPNVTNNELVETQLARIDLLESETEILQPVAAVVNTGGGTDNTDSGSSVQVAENQSQPELFSGFKFTNESHENQPTNNEAFNAVFDDASTDIADANAKSQTEAAKTDMAMANIASTAHAKTGSLKLGVREVQQPEGDWQFVVRYDDYGIGSINLNGLDLPSVLLNRNTSLLFDEIGMEVKRRMEFLEPRLTQGISGSVTVADKSFAFDNSSGLQAALVAGRDQVDLMKFKSISVDELFRIRDDYLIELKRNSNRPQYVALTKIINKNSPQQIAQKRSLQFFLQEEIDVITEVVGKTTQVLQQLSKERLNFEEQNSLVTVEHVNPNGWSIDNDRFSKLARFGKLKLPPVASSRATSLQLQGLNVEQVKMALHGSTHSLDIFFNANELEAAQRFVTSKDQVAQNAGLRTYRAQIRNEVKRLSASEALRVDEQDRLHALKNELAFVTKQLKAKNGEALEPLKEILPHRPDLQALPLVMGDDCHFSKDDAQTMATVSKRVGETLGKFDNFGSRDISKNTLWRYMLLMQEITNCCKLDNPTQAFKTLEQMLQIDHPRLRLELIETVRAMKPKASIDLLVRRAKFDIQPKVRQAATKALKEFDTDTVRQKLLDGFEYPWHVVAQHAAETLVGLDDLDAIPQLIDLLGKNDPRLPYEVSDAKYVQHELVAINHMKNCMLCHAPSTNESDSGRALTPTFLEPLPAEYYSPVVSPSSAFVRADVTYLRQDFSVIQIVENPGPWPAEQRFDYVVKNKSLTAEQAASVTQAINAQENKNRSAVVFALEKLTGQVVEDNSQQAWTEVYQTLK